MLLNGYIITFMRMSSYDLSCFEWKHSISFSIGREMTKKAGNDNLFNIAQCTTFRIA